jgi:hypothetical protein
MKKLYKVRIEDIVYVMAESEEEAVDIARYESDGSAWRKGDTAIVTRENFDESTGWSMHCIPFGEEELSIEEILNEE